MRPNATIKCILTVFIPGLVLIVPSSSVSYCLWMSIAPPIFKRRIARQKRCVGKPVALSIITCNRGDLDHSTMDKAPVRQRSTDPKAGKISAREDRLHDQTRLRALLSGFGGVCLIAC